MDRKNRDKPRRADHSREADPSTAPTRRPEREEGPRSSQPQEPTGPTPMFEVDWHRVGWYVLGALVGGGGYALALLMLVYFLVEPAALIDPIGLGFALYTGGYLIGLVVLLMRRPRFVLYEAVTAAVLSFTASGFVPAYTTVTVVTAPSLVAFGGACLVPGVLAGGWHLYRRRFRTQRSGVRRHPPRR